MVSWERNYIHVHNVLCKPSYKLFLRLKALEKWPGSLGLVVNLTLLRASSVSGIPHYGLPALRETGVCVLCYIRLIILRHDYYQSCKFSDDVGVSKITICIIMYMTVYLLHMDYVLFWHSKS